MSSSEQSSGSCSRRDALKRIGLASGTLVTLGAGGSKVAPRYAPVGRAAAHPAIAVGAAIAVGVGFRYMTGAYDSEDSPRDSSEYQTLERLALWADAFRTFASNEATNEMLAATTEDLADFSVNRLKSEVVLGALEEIEATDGDPGFETALASGEERILSEGAQMERNMLNEGALFATELATFLGDVDVVTDADAGEMLQFIDSSNTLDNVVLEDWHDFEVTLEDGSTWTKNLPTFRIEITWSSGSATYYSHPIPSPTVSRQDVTVDGEALSDFTSSDDWDALGTGGARKFELASWPQDEYDSLDEESKEGIEPPEDPTANPNVYYPVYDSAVSAVYDAIDQATSEAETYLDPLYDDLVSGDLSTDDVLTPTMLAEISSDQETYPYAGAAASAMGLPSSAQSVTLRFPNSTEEVENEDGEMVEQPVESTGKLYANPMPSSGFNVGNEYDPANLDSTIYYAYHVVDDEGNQSSEMTTLEEPFEVVSAQEVDPETGEVQDVDEVTYSERGIQGTETDYDALIAALEDISNIEQEAAAEQQEIVVELEGEANNGGGGFWDFGDSGNGPIVVIAAIVAALLYGK